MSTRFIHRTQADPKPERRPWQPATVTIPQWMREAAARNATQHVPVEIPVTASPSRLRRERNRRIREGQGLA